MWYKILTHFVPRFLGDKFRYKMREYFLQTKRLIRVVSLMVGKKYSRILCLVRPIFVLIENMYAFCTTISAQYFLVQNTHAFFTMFLVILYMVQNTHTFFAIFLWYENNAKNGRKSSSFCPNDDQLLWTSHYPSQQTPRGVPETKVFWSKESRSNWMHQSQ